MSWKERTVSSNKGPTPGTGSSQPNATPAPAPKPIPSPPPMQTFIKGDPPSTSFERDTKKNGQQTTTNDWRGKSTS
jgi:hypothetical protein